jgi:flagellar hook-associated protein 3 FlgL
MRVTQNLFYRANQQNLGDGLARLFRTQQEISSGKRIQRPSDDAVGAARLLSVSRRLGEVEQYDRNAELGRGFAESAADSLQSASSIIQSAREAIIQGLNGTYDAPSRATLADEISGQIDDLLAIANTRVGGRYLFGGTAADQAPFFRETSASGRDVVSYRGNDQVLRTEVGPDVRAPLNLPGLEVFSTAPGRGPTRYGGLTGATAAATGTDSGEGVGILSVRHQSTAIFGGGLQPGASSIGGDTILGTNHNVTLGVNAVTGEFEVTLNGGEAVVFDGTETDLRVAGPHGELIHLDMTGVTPGFTGNIIAVGAGTMSFDGGVTETPIDFAADSQRIFDSETGEVINVDPRNIRQAGEESVVFGGATDLFSSLIAIRDELLRVGEVRPEEEDLDFIRDLLDELDGAYERILVSTGRLGGIGARLEAVGNRLSDERVRLQGQKSEIDDVDLAEATARLSQEETAYQATLLITQRIGQLSLLNYLG